MTKLQWFFVFFGIYAFALVLIALLIRRTPSGSAALGGSRRDEVKADFFTGGLHPFGLVALVFTFAASLMSAFFVVGMPGFGYTHGIILWPYVIFGDVLGLLALYVVARRVIFLKQEMEAGDRARIVSPLEIVSSSKFGRVTILLVTALFVLPYLGVQISGFGRLITETTEGAVSFLVAASGTMLLLWFYSSVSGIRGVVYSDLLQGVLLLAAAIFLASYFVVTAFGSPVALLQEVSTQRPDLLSSPGPRGLGTYPTLFSSMILFAALFISQPQFMTRWIMFGDKEPERKLRRMVIGLGFALAVLTVPVAFVGLGGALLYPDLANGDQLVGTILATRFPDWVAMAITVGVLAAAMSTADSILFSISQMLTKDVLIDVFKLEMSQLSSIAIARVSLLLLGAAALVIGVSSNQLIVQLSSLAFAGCLQVVPAVVGGLWNRNGSAYSGPISAIVGVLSLFAISSSASFPTLGFHPAIPSVIIASIAYLVCDLTVRATRRPKAAG